MVRAAHTAIFCVDSLCGQGFVARSFRKEHQQYQCLGILPQNPVESGPFYVLPGRPTRASPFSCFVVPPGGMTAPSPILDEPDFRCMHHATSQPSRPAWLPTFASACL